MKKQPTQSELFKTFWKEFTQAQLCEYCLLTHETHTYLTKFPGEYFFRYAQLCDKCVLDPKIEVK
jgi:superfamily II helicase